MFMYVSVCIYMCKYSYLVPCHVCRGQRTASGVSPWLPPCLRQSLSLFQCVGHASWSMTVWTVSEAVRCLCYVSGCNVSSEDLNLFSNSDAKNFDALSSDLLNEHLSKMNSYAIFPS